MPKRSDIEIVVRKELSVDDLWVVSLVGRLDLFNSNKINEKMDKLLVENKAKKIIMNLAEVKYLSSGGIRMIVQLVKKIRKDGGELLLCSLSKAVKDVLDMVGFNLLFTTYETEQDAIQNFKDNI